MVPDEDTREPRNLVRKRLSLAQTRTTSKNKERVALAGRICKHLEDPTPSLWTLEAVSERIIVESFGLG